ncbi:interactor of constitutive active ROPs 2, chloroplastic-like [Salvia miltiorrhiza]|uniref:interactor of constitutive active ROPs 2, chloroplastic-like n=1 Tax=Salvia miltiorrhiza TaxID=226208 RepID=UPI0025AD9007|nr:interactor of constitutive active ROPs 2, chloroplastic-like [Salvia miltiorrhiza]XP_057779013.1 interactor of constitutive active ROPs 2, chloroplastic-like [Salvia miltiorrhiza]
MQTTTSRGGGGSALQNARKLKTAASDSTCVSSPNPIIKTAKDRSLKTIDRRLPRAPVTEKKRPNKPSESEARIAQLQEDLKKTKEQLSSSESWKRRAQQEAEEGRKQLAAMAAELEESRNQLKELSECEEARLQELRKISQERDREWQSELEAFQKQYSMDSAALSSAMNEIQKLKMQLDRVSQSEAAQARHAESAHAEIQSLRVELTETLLLVDRLKTQLNDSRDYESHALDEVSRAETQLQVVKTAENELKLEHDNVVELYNALLLDLEKSNCRVKSLEELVATLQSDLANSSNVSANSSAENGDREAAELNALKGEMDELRSALADAERRYRDEYIQSTMQIRNAYQLVELTRSESSEKEAQLDAKLRESRAEVEELRIKLFEKENAASNLEEDDDDEREAELKASLLDKEAQLQATAEENEMLRREMMKTETEQSKAEESSQAAEQEALLQRLDSLTEEANKSCKKVARVTEQLDAAQASNSELEAELRRLKVQCDQWRKAAEAAAAMLSTTNNGKYGERRGSFDYHSITSKLSSPQSDDEDDDSPKKKNGNMLKKIGVLLKKGHK